ncbi:cysteine proteinase [Venturia nashicola]|nr:cysteine proteinase [Venturia nashicola]
MKHDSVGDAQYGKTIPWNQDSFFTNVSALALFSFVVIPLLLNIPHLDFARGVYVFGHKMASRITSRLLSYTPAGLQKSVGDGSALKSLFAFGLDSGMIKSGLEALKGPKSNTPPGLGNCNNSCYQNSIIQGLSSIRCFREFLANVPSQDSSPSSVNTALSNVIEDLNNSGNYGSYLWLPSALKLMTTYQQQDAQEYFSKVMGEVENELARQAKKRRLSGDSGLGEISSPNIPPASESATKSTYYGNPLEGLQAQRVGCTQCKHSDGLSMTPFTNWTVPLGQHAYEVRDCFDEYTSLESIPGVQCPKCTLLNAQRKYHQMLRSTNLPPNLLTDIRKRLQTVEDALREEDFSDATLIHKCNIPKSQWASVLKTKQVTIARAPKSLIVHINRSAFNEHTGETYKNSSAVQFPSVFNLDAWCLGKNSAAESEGAEIERWLMDPNRSMLDSSATEIPDSPPNYELRAVVTHSGSHGSGHYVCYRKAVYIEPDPPSIDGHEIDAKTKGNPAEEWWRLSDENVRLVSEQAVLQQGGVFMLFYERIDDQIVPERFLDSVHEIGADVAADVPELTDARNEAELIDACGVALPDESNDEFDSEDVLMEEEKKVLLPPRHAQAWISPPPPTNLEISEINKADADIETEEDESENHDHEDLFQSRAATVATPAGQRVRMRTSSAFAHAQTSGGDDPLQSPVRMGTAF